MKLKDTLHETYSALISNKVRTGLTMLGIIIGIGSVIAMVSIGQGAQGSIETSIQSAGSNLLTISPGAQQSIGSQTSSARGSARTLTEEDAEAITEKISSVNAVSAELSGRYQVAGRGTNTNTSVTGVTSYYPLVRNVKINEGIFITEQHNRSYGKVAVLGPTTKKDLFGEKNAVGETIRINGIQWKIVGITEEKGGSGFGNQDDMIFVPLRSAQKFLAGDDYVSSISVQANSAEVMTETQTEITSLLLERHKIKNEEDADFSIFNMADLTEAISTVTQTFTLLLGSVAGISLLVGGIGIMNMMLTTVTERTREIGLRKAIGAKKKDINKQFLIEAIILTLIGGILGMVLGGLVSFVITQFGVLETKISFDSVALAFSVSAGIGIIFGYYPAKRASGFNPIDALRYE